MPSQLSPKLETRTELVDTVRRTDRILMPMLQRHSQSARALWDVRQDPRGRERLMLALTDPWGYAAGDFAPDDLTNEDELRRRFRDLIGDMNVRRGRQQPHERIEIRDVFADLEQLENFRLRLGGIRGIEGARLRLHNQVRFVAERPERYLLTGFAVEVDQPFANAVRDVVQQSGFQLRDDPSLIQREGVRDALRRLVDEHRGDGQPAPEFAVCFQLQDRETVHLLEVSSDAPEVGDDSLEGVGFSARGVVPCAELLKIYLTHPNDLRAAFQRNRDHDFFRDLRAGNCDFLFPDDEGGAFYSTFPDLLET